MGANGLPVFTLAAGFYGIRKNSLSIRLLGVRKYGTIFQKKIEVLKHP
jgi:hypothetical protein